MWTQKERWFKVISYYRRWLLGMCQWISLFILLSHDGVTADRVWIGNMIYWTFNTQLVATLYKHYHTKKSVLSYCVHCFAYLRLPTVDDPLLQGSGLHNLAAFSHQLPILGVGVGVGVRLAADSQSTSTSGYRASLWDPWPDFILLFFFRLTITSFCYQCVLSDEKTGL
jgi:hypothetical protein